MHNELTLSNHYYYIELYIYHCFSLKCIPLFRCISLLMYTPKCLNGRTVHTWN